MQRSAREAEQQQRETLNRRGYVRLIEESAASAPAGVLEASLELFERLVRVGAVSLQPIIQWNADVATEAQLAQLVELDDRVEKWVRACAEALPRLLADCRLRGTAAPEGAALAVALADRAQLVLPEVAPAASREA